MGVRNSKVHVEEREENQQHGDAQVSKRCVRIVSAGRRSDSSDGKAPPCCGRDCVRATRLPQSSSAGTQLCCTCGETRATHGKSVQQTCVNVKSHEHEAQEKDSLEELGDVVAKLQETVLQLNQRFPSEDNFYIQQTCKTLVHSVNALKKQRPATKDASRCTGPPKVVEKKRRKGKGPDSLDSSSSAFVSLTNQISTALLLRLVTKMTNKNKSHIRGEDLDTIWNRLTDLVAAELDACDCDLLRTEANIKDVTKNMVRSLLKTFGSPESLLLAAMSPQNRAFDKAVMSFLRGKLNVQKKKNIVSRCFSAIAKMFT